VIMRKRTRSDDELELALASQPLSSTMGADEEVAGGGSESGKT
jgi:hypothetical protein